MTEKCETIKAYFDRWREDLARVKMLMADSRYDEVQIKNGTRYISPQDFLTCVEQRPFPGLNKSNFREHLPRFSLCEMLYRYLRCSAVHGVRFPFVDKPRQVGGGPRYEDNHAITGPVLLETTENILTNMQLECLEKAKWPEEL